MGGSRYPHMRRGILCALLGGIFWGLSGNCVEVLTTHWDVTVNWLSSVRMGCSCVFFLALSAFFDRRQMTAVLRDGKSLVSVVGFALLGILLTQVSYMEAIRLTGASVELLLEQLGMALVMLYTCLVLRRAPNRRESLGLVFALAGVALIATQGKLGALGIPLDGLIWGLVSAVALMFYNIMPVRPLKRYSAFSVSGFAMLIAFAVGLVILRPWETPAQLPPEGWVVLGIVVVFGTFAAYLLYVQGIKDAGPVRASLLASVEPVSAMVIAAVWLGDFPSLFDLLGAAAIITMIVLVTGREEKTV